MLYGGTYTESTTESTAGGVLLENHCHAQFELIAVFSGNVSLYPEGGMVSLSSGQAVLIPPLFYHAVDAESGGSYRRYTLLFDEAALPSPLRPVFTALHSPLCVRASDCLTRLEKVLQSERRSYYAPLADSLLTELFYRFAELPDGQIQPESRELADILNYIEANLNKRITLEDIARHTARSKSSVCHIFSERMKISVKQYILQKKLSYAEKCMEEGLSASDAARAVGYENYSNFYRMYQKVFGRSPVGKKRLPQ